jgi:hypothetical protein
MSEHLDRLNAMLDYNQQTWDLSPNDIAAIQWAVDEIERLHHNWLTEQGARLSQANLVEMYTATKAKQMQAELEQQQAENRRLLGTRNLLADKLAHCTGYPVPTEIRAAEWAVDAGAEAWDWERGMYVDEDGKEVTDE